MAGNLLTRITVYPQDVLKLLKEMEGQSEYHKMLALRILSVSGLAYARETVKGWNCGESNDQTSISRLVAPPTPVDPAH